jgi:hypothetical protein
MRKMTSPLKYTKLPVLLLFLSVMLSAFAQEDKGETYLCQNGMIHFFSATAMENIDATSNTTVCAMNTKSKKVVARVKQTSFTFKDKLMQEHFNENYMESEKYPMSNLDMVIAGDIDFSKDGTYQITLKGTLEMHGVKKEREIKGTLTIKNGQMNAKAVFMVKLADHNIQIPSVVGANIAEEVKVDVDFNLNKAGKK